MTNKTKIIIGVSVVALVGGYFIYKRMRINKPMDNIIGDEDRKGVVPPAPPLKKGLLSDYNPSKFGYSPNAPAFPTKPTIEEVKEMNRLIALP
jgi:hypothetical protein